MWYVEMSEICTLRVYNETLGDFGNRDIWPLSELSKTHIFLDLEFFTTLVSIWTYGMNIMIL